MEQRDKGSTVQSGTERQGEHSTEWNRDKRSTVSVQSEAQRQQEHSGVQSEAERETRGVK